MAQGGLMGTPASSGNEEMVVVGVCVCGVCTLQQVLLIPLEESRWVLKDCLQLGIVTRWYWEEQDQECWL